MISVWRSPSCLNRLNISRIMPLSPPNPVIANKYSVYQGLTTADPEIIKGIKLIGTQNLAMGLQGLTQFLDLMNSPTTVQTFTDFEEDFVNAIVSLLRYLQTLDPVSDPTVARIYRYLFTSIDTFYQKPLLGKRIPVASLKQLINQLIILLVEEKLEKCGDVYVKAIHVYCVQIIEQSDHTAILCALVKLMTECITNDNCPERQVDLVMKCLWKVMKLMPTWGENVDYESVLLEVHQFLVKFPSKWWTKRPVDTPLRTIKTIVHSTVKIKGANSMQLLSKIPNPAESEMESYILRLLKQTTATGVKPKSKQAKSPIKLSLSRKTVSPTKKPQNKPIITLPTVRIESPMKYYSPPQNLQKPQIIQNVLTENNCFPKEKQSYKGTPNIYSNTTPRQFLPAVCFTNSKSPSMNNSNESNVLRTELFLQTNQSFHANESNETYTKINLSSSTYTKGNSSFETCIVGNMSARTYVKDSSIGDSENLDKSPISSLQREHSSPLTYRQKSSEFFPNLEVNKSDFKAKKGHISSIAEESYVFSESALKIGSKRKKSDLGIHPSEREKISPKLNKNWSKKGGTAFRIAKSTSGLKLDKCVSPVPKNNAAQPLLTFAETKM